MKRYVCRIEACREDLTQRVLSILQRDRDSDIHTAVRNHAPSATPRSRRVHVTCSKGHDNAFTIAS